MSATCLVAETFRRRELKSIRVPQAVVISDADVGRKNFRLK
jgi:hypothetical protein